MRYKSPVVRVDPDHCEERFDSEASADPLATQAECGASQLFPLAESFPLHHVVFDRLLLAIPQDEEAKAAVRTDSRDHAGHVNRTRPKPKQIPGLGTRMFGPVHFFLPS